MSGERGPVPRSVVNNGGEVATKIRIVENNADRIEAIVPAGEYFLCDPRDVIPAGKWAALIKSCDAFNGSPIGTIDGLEVLAFYAKMGNGLYGDGEGGRYEVESGLIGLTSVRVTPERVNDWYGASVGWTFDTRCRLDRKTGCMRFGDTNIYTGMYAEGDGFGGDIE
jgi:hypothetical protein